MKDLSKDLYKKTFKQVEMSERKASQMQAGLLASLKKKQMEDEAMEMKKHFKKTRRVLYPVAILVLALSCSVMAYGPEKVTQHVMKLFSGGTAEIGSYTKTNEKGEVIEEGSYAQVEFTGDEQQVYKVKDGQVYFIADGQNIDITKQCSEDTYYKYEKTDEDGLKHIIVVGGSIEYLGWAEYIFDEKKDYSNNILNIPVDENGKVYGTWNAKAELELGIINQEEYQQQLNSVHIE